MFKTEKSTEKTRNETEQRFSLLGELNNCETELAAQVSAGCPAQTSFCIFLWRSLGAGEPCGNFC